MSDPLDAPFMKKAGMVQENHSVICAGCGRGFVKNNDLLRHWRVPIPCQVDNCMETFRDDKLQVYLNHHRRMHSVNGLLPLSQAQVESYFHGAHQTGRCQSCD
jgi:hypothetical protein